MASIKSLAARKAAKSTAKHSLRGTASKLKREPLRTGTLLSVGCVAGFVAGRFAARPAQQSPA
jgi:hypothetical protein